MPQLPISIAAELRAEHPPIFPAPSLSPADKIPSALNCFHEGRGLPIGSRRLLLGFPLGDRSVSDGRNTIHRVIHRVVHRVCSTRLNQPRITRLNQVRSTRLNQVPWESGAITVVVMPPFGRVVLANND